MPQPATMEGRHQQIGLLTLTKLCENTNNRKHSMSFFGCQLRTLLLCILPSFSERKHLALLQFSWYGVVSLPRRGLR